MFFHISLFASTKPNPLAFTSFLAAAGIIYLIVINIFKLKFDKKNNQGLLVLVIVLALIFAYIVGNIKS